MSSSFQLGKIQHMQDAICNIYITYALCNILQYAILCNLHVSLVPSIGGVEVAWHDDKVVNPVADVEQAKHWIKEKF